LRDIEQLAEEIQKLTGQVNSEAKASEEWSNIRAQYQAAFNTNAGRPVLRDMLRDLRFLQVPRSDNDVVLQAYATVLLRKLGVIQDDGPDDGVIGKLISYLPPVPKE